MARFAAPVVVEVGAAWGLNLTGWIGKTDCVNEVQLEPVLGLFPVDNMPGTELTNSWLLQNAIILLAPGSSNHYHPSIHNELHQRLQNCSYLPLLPRWHQLNHPKSS